MQRVRAARIRPNVREGNFGRSSLLQQQFGRGGIEQEDAECAMEDAARLGWGEFMRGLFRRRVNEDIVFISYEDGVTLHELSLGHGCSIPVRYNCTACDMASSPASNLSLSQCQRGKRLMIV